MKSVVADYRYRVVCLRIVPIYGAATVLRLTEHPRDLTMANGQVYRSDAGYEFTGISAGSGGAAAVIDLDGVIAATGVRREDVASGVYDNARVYLFATSWRAPVENEEPLAFGFLGKTVIRDDRYGAEIMSAQDVLSQAVGETHAPNCQKKFGGQEFGGCGVDLGPLTVTGTLTAVTSASSFTDSARAEAADTFTAGLIEFTSGANAGLKAQEIQAHATGGVISLFEAFPYPPAIGDAYSLVPGCRKRKVDCQAHGNILRFGGKSFVPTGKTYAKIGTGNA